ncbi:MAG TPA: cytochrome c-type biogenesis protein CcmH [Candidatus Polarisedimenticolaceae bacterium]|nr:cytochrome c-type biogenesis protein CcmH [Candidatus Polarisedimenticolaceae bacterium]
MTASGAYEEAASAILCDCGCHPQSVKDCACARAGEMRQEIAAEAKSGKTGDAIVAGYVARYGQKILVTPPAAGFNLVAWVGPPLGLLAAALALALLIRRWRRSSRPAAEPTAAGSPDPADLARLQSDLEELR